MKLKYITSIGLLLPLIVISAMVKASGSNFRVDEIPKPLLKDAKAVVRYEEIIVDLKSNGNLDQKVKYVVTILNKNGLSNSYFTHVYNNNIKVSNIKTRVYDKTGVEIEKKGGYDIQDYALISEGTTYADQRIKAINPEQLEYPYTVVYTYEVSFSDVLQYPGWLPVKDINVSVESSKYTLIVPKDANCRYFEKNITSKVNTQNTKEGIVYTWELTNQPALTDENLSPALADYTPTVLIAPSQINIEGYKGNIETWAGFGQWINQLNKGKNNLNAAAKAKILNMVAGITDERAKIKVLYEYMQNKTRYVSIQVGIGGFQPFDAETVDRLSYGDCKALSFYMKSILEVAGISSLYTLVLAGDEKPTVYSEFPSNQFNHAILCVPITNDTIWLECTSQSNPFNYMSTFTADRQVLVIDDKGAKLIKTPSLELESNLESRKVFVTLDPSGSGYAGAKNIFHGATYDNYTPILMSDQADRKKMITRKIHIPNFELDNFDIRETKAENPYVTEKLNLTITNYCTKVGDKLILRLNLMNKMSESPFQAEIRKCNISIKWPVNEVDTVIYELPKGYTMEKIPPITSFLSDFGKYTSVVTKTGSTIQYIRTFEIYKGEYPVDKYEDIVIFFDKVVTADENKVMLTKVL